MFFIHIIANSRFATVASASQVPFPPLRTMPALHPLTRTLLAHCEELVAYVHQQFPQRDFARDVIHEVCAQLLSNPPAVEISKPLAYLRKMSLHRALDWCRGPGGRQAAEWTQDTPAAEPVHHEDGACLLDFQQQLQALIVIIQALPDRPRQCFLLYRVHDMAPAEIAQAIGLSRNAVNQHICTAIKRIRLHWEPAQQHAIDCGMRRAASARVQPARVLRRSAAASRHAASHHDLSADAIPDLS